MDLKITSIKDARVVEARSLGSASGRLAAQKFLLEGEEQILWAIHSSCKIEHIFVHDHQSNAPILAELKKKNIPLFFVTDGILKKITDTSYLIPFVGVVRFPPMEKNKSDCVIVLDEVNDFGNVGTIVRTAAAFAIHEFVSTKENQDFFYKKTISTSIFFT